MSTMDSGPKSKWLQWSSWGVIAVVATLAGLLLPQMIPGESVSEKPRPKLETKDKPGWEYAAPTLPDVPNPQAMFVRLALGTIFVLGLCVVSLWGMRRWMLIPGVSVATAREMQLKETLQLGNRCILHLVHLGKQPVLVGVDASGIKTIVPLASAFDELLADAETPAAAKASELPLSKAAA